MSSDIIGRGNCPTCGIILITNIKSIVVNLPPGLSLPTAYIFCEKCGGSFTAPISYESYLIWDGKGCIVNGYSRRTAPMINESEIESYMEEFDSYLENFLDIIDSEQKGLF